MNYCNLKAIAVAFLAVVGAEAGTMAPCGGQVAEAPARGEAPGAPRETVERKAKMLKERYEALAKELDDKQQAFKREYLKAKDEQQRADVFKRLYPPREEYAKKFLALAREEPSAPAALDALYMAMHCGGSSPEAAAAIEQVRRDWVRDPKMAEMCQQFIFAPFPNVETLLREVLKTNPDHAAQGAACLALASWLATQAELPRLRAQDPKMAEMLEKAYGKQQLDRLAKRDTEAMVKEAEELHERVLAQYAGVRMFPAFPQDRRTIGEQSKTWLEQRRELTVGAVAPEIEGVDVDGKAFKLSDHRGKVVVVIFWASWCGPCMEQIPHERDLVRRFEGKPFVLLGVNCDYTRAEAKAVLAKEKITWPNWYDGEGSEGPIRARYHVQSLPLILVLDAAGVIRDNDVRGKGLAEAVDTLMNKLESSRVGSTHQRIIK